jgi:hypothetical protein
MRMIDQPKKKFSKIAIISLFLAGFSNFFNFKIGFFAFIVTWLIAFFLAIYSLVQIFRNKTKLKGRLYAVMAILVSLLYLPGMLAIYVLSYPRFQSGRWHAQLTQTEKNPCKDNFQGDKFNLRFVSRPARGQWEIVLEGGQTLQGFDDPMSGLILDGNNGASMNIQSSQNTKTWSVIYFPEKPKLSNRDDCVTRYAGQLIFDGKGNNFDG